MKVGKINNQPAPNQNKMFECDLKLLEVGTNVRGIISDMGFNFVRSKMLEVTKEKTNFVVWINKFFIVVVHFLNTLLSWSTFLWKIFFHCKILLVVNTSSFPS